MNNPLFYNNILYSKNGSKIPVLNNLHTVESQYNPNREAEKTIMTIDKDYKFFIIMGIGSGIILDYLIKKFPRSIFLCFEFSSNNLSFLIDNHFLDKYLQNEKFVFSTINNLNKILLENYIPSLFGDLKILENSNWKNEYKQYQDEIQKNLNDTIKSISADYSVQAHFGKIWQTNFLSNLQQLTRTKNIEILNKMNINKKAIIFGAGPSIDQKILLIKQSKEDYFIIATDTITTTLIKNNIYPDIVISIDGQHISYTHFLLNTNLLTKTLFLFDVTANSSAINHLIQNNCNVLYFVSGHPLSQCLNNFCNNSFLSLFTGSGTVIIAALDLAFKLGFSEIDVLGADFSYTSKPYAKGTYLDYLYSINSSKIHTIESNFDSLLFRSTLSKCDNGYTTETLNSYKESFEYYLKNTSCKYSLIDKVYHIENHNACTISKEQYDFTLFDSSKFIQSLIINCSSEENLFYNKSIFPFLPYIAWIRKNNNKKDYTIQELVKLAQTSLLLYN